MTHDELLKKITYGNEGLSVIEDWHNYRHALYSVVELHHPYTDKIVYCQECECLYPCPTIRAIKGELA